MPREAVLLVQAFEGFLHLRHVLHGVLFEFHRHIVTEEAAWSCSQVAALVLKPVFIIHGRPLKAERKLRSLLLVVRRPSDFGRSQRRASSGLRSAAHYLAHKLFLWLHRRAKYRGLLKIKTNIIYNE